VGVHNLGDEQYGVDQGSLAAGGMSDNGYRANLCGVNWHLENLPKNWFTL
jgi:hypothetical protein